MKKYIDIQDLYDMGIIKSENELPVIVKAYATDECIEYSDLEEIGAWTMDENEDDVFSEECEQAMEHFDGKDRIFLARYEDHGQMPFATKFGVGVYLDASECAEQFAEELKHLGDYGWDWAFDWDLEIENEELDNYELDDVDVCQAISEIDRDFYELICSVPEGGFFDVEV